MVEGRARQKLFTAGKWVDEVNLGLLSDEWEAAYNNQTQYTGETKVDFNKT